MKVDYNQVARYEAAIELLNSLRAVFASMRNYEEIKTLCETRRSELMREKQRLNPKDDAMVSKIGEVYAPLVREYYENPSEFVMSDKFLKTKIEL